MKLRKSDYVFFLIIFFTVYVTGGCAFRQADDYSLPVIEYDETVEVTEFENFTGRWWQNYSDTGLEKLVRTSLSNNFSLRAAHRRMRAARQVVARESADGYPDLEAELGARQGEVESGGVESNFSYDLTASYEVDLWGKIEAASEAARYNYRASAMDLQTAAITLSARVANTWARIVSRSRVLALEKKLIKVLREQEQLLRERYRRGKRRLSRVTEAQNKLESTGRRITALESELEMLNHELAVLLGRQPDTEIGPETEKLSLPAPLPDTGLQVETIRRRPDVRSAFYEVKAADRDLARAISAQYPRLNLSFSGSNQATSADELFTDWAGAFAANIAAPLLDGGRRRAEVDRTKEKREQKVSSYGQTVLTALREVKDAFSRELARREQLRSNRKSYRLARENQQQVTTRFRNGKVNYSEVLSALINRYENKRELIIKRRELVESRIQTYRVLSGGWEL